jgi:prevent-host-death family protein
MRPLRVGVRDAKAHLSRLVKLVREGREIVLTDRGKPVGKIVPIAQEELPLSERVRRLEEEGVIEKVSASRSRKTLSPVSVPEGIAQRRLQEDRNHG